jgi:hypothetical protein
MRGAFYQGCIRRDLPFVEEPPQCSELGGANLMQADCVGLGCGNDGPQFLRFPLQEVRIEAKLDVVDL